MNKIKKSIVAGIAIFAFSSNANATGYPVFDAGANTQLSAAVAELKGIIGGQIAQTGKLTGFSQALNVAIETQKMFDNFKNKVYEQFGGTGALAREVVENCLKMPSMPNFLAGLNFDFGLNCVQGHLLKGLGLDQLLSFKLNLQDILAGDMKSAKSSFRKKTDNATRKIVDTFSMGVNAESDTASNAAKRAGIKHTEASATASQESTIAKQLESDEFAKDARIETQLNASKDSAKAGAYTNPAANIPSDKEIAEVKRIADMPNNTQEDAKRINTAIIDFQNKTGKDFATVLMAVQGDAATNYGNDKLVSDKLFVLPTIKAEGKSSGGSVPQTSLMIEGNNIKNYNKIHKAYIEQLKEIEKAAHDATSASSTNKNAGNIDIKGLQQMVDNVGVTPMTASILSMLQSGTVMSNIVVDANRRGSGSNGEPSAMSDGQKAALSSAQTQGIIMQLVLLNQNIFEMNKLLAELAVSQHAQTQQKLDDINYQIKQVQFAVEFLNASTKK